MFLGIFFSVSGKDSPWRSVHNMKAFAIENDMQCLYSSSLINAVTTTWQRSLCREQASGGEPQVVSSKETVKLFQGSDISEPQAFCAA